MIIRWEIVLIIIQKSDNNWREFILFIFFFRMGPLPCLLEKTMYFFFFFWLCWVFVAGPWLSLAAAGGDSSRVAVRGGLAVVVSLVQSTGSQARRLQSLAHGRSSCGCGV